MAGYRAQYNLGTFYYQGQGVAQDTELACKWFESAADAGYTDAEYMSGEGCRSEPYKALVWAEVARQNGEAQAPALLARAERGLRDPEKSAALQQAALCIKSGYRDCPE